MPPDAIGRLSNLEFFALTQSKVSGTIPSEFGKLSNLKYFFIVSTFQGIYPEKNGTRPRTSHTTSLIVVLNFRRPGILLDLSPVRLATCHCSVSIEIFMRSCLFLRQKVPNENSSFFLVVAEDLAFTMTNVNGTIPDNICEKQKNGALNLGAIPVSADCPCCLAPNNSSKVFGN